MSRRSDNVKSWRKRTKKRIIESMGGECQICGYSKCDSALALHHLIPEEKEISFGSIRANPRSWIKIVEELRKCVLICHNCHSEVHDGYTILPEKYKTFNDDYIKYNIDKFVEHDNCSICGKEKPVVNKYCSLSCSGKSKFKVDWDSIDLKKMFGEYSIVKIAEILNISNSAVNKRLRKLGLK